MEGTCHGHGVPAERVPQAQFACLVLRMWTDAACCPLLLACFFGAGEAAAAAKQAATAAKQGGHSQDSSSPAGSNSDSECDGISEVDHSHDPITAVFGAFSGNVPIAQGEYERLQEQLRARKALGQQPPAASAARQQGRRGGGGGSGSDTKAGGRGGVGKGRRRGRASQVSGSVRGRSVNGWDAALAHLDAAAVKGGEAKGDGAEQQGGDDEEEQGSEEEVAEEENEEGNQEAKTMGRGAQVVRTRRPHPKRRNVDKGTVSKGRSRASKGSSGKSAAEADSGPEGSDAGSSSLEVEEVEEEEAWLQDEGSEQGEGAEASSTASSDASSGATTSSSSGEESDDGDNSLSDSGSLDLTSRGASTRAKRQGCWAGVEGGRVKRLRSSCSSVDVSGLASTATAFEGNAPTPMVQGRGGAAGSLGQGQGTDGAQQRPYQEAKLAGDTAFGMEGSSGAVAAGLGKGDGVVRRAARQASTEPARLCRKQMGSAADQEGAQQRECKEQQEQRRGRQEPPEDVSMVAITESELNGGNGASPAAARFLVVCSKYETGYDDPRLGTMFLDRPVSGAKAVQVLGRLNRQVQGMG